MTDLASQIFKFTKLDPRFQWVLNKTLPEKHFSVYRPRSKHLNLYYEFHFCKIMGPLPRTTFWHQYCFFSHVFFVTVWLHEIEPFKIHSFSLRSCDVCGGHKCFVILLQVAIFQPDPILDESVESWLYDVHDTDIELFQG